MSDLTDAEIEEILGNSLGDLEFRMAHELQRRRAEQAAGREHVERVVKEAMSEAAFAIDRSERTDDFVARRVADRLSVPAKPSLASRREALGMRKMDETERRDLLAANIDDGARRRSAD